MNERAPQISQTDQNPAAFHETVEQYATEIDTRAKNGGIIPNYAETTQTADIDGERLAVHTEGPTGGYSNEIKEATAAVNQVEDLGDIPENIPGNKVDLGLRHSKAELFQEELSGGSKYSRASVKTTAGDYRAKESVDIKTGTHVDRPGYGTVEINNPKARELVAKLAGKKIAATQLKIQEVKGKEDVSDRDWHKTARRSLRRIAGKKVA